MTTVVLLFFQYIFLLNIITKKYTREKNIYISVETLEKRIFLTGTGLRKFRYKSLSK